MEWFSKGLSRIEATAEETWKSLEKQIDFFVLPEESDSHQQSGSGAQGDPAESVIITAEMKEFASTLCDHPDTFLSFPLDMIPSMALPEGQSAPFVFTRRQLRHAQLMIEAVPALQRLRYQLCPKELTEDQFWQVYFLLTRKRLGRSLADSDEALPLHVLRDEVPYIKTKREVREQQLQRQEGSETYWLGCIENPTEERHSKKMQQFHLRKGVPDSCRQKVWMMLCGGAVDEYTAGYLETRNRMFGAHKFSVQFELLQGFLHNKFSFVEHHLTKGGVNAAKAVMWILSKKEPESLHNQYAADLVCLFLHFLSEEQTFGIFRCMMQKPKFHNYSMFAFTFFPAVLHQLIQLYNPDVAQHMEKLHLDGDFTEPWFCRLFIGVLPFQTVLRITDCFLVEGDKLLFKVGLALLHMYSNTLLSCSSEEEFKETLIKEAKECHDADLLIEVASQFPIKSSHLLSLLKEVRDDTLPTFNGLSAIIDQDQWAALWFWLPQRYTLSHPTALFRSSKDGFNLNTLILKCQKQQPLILLIKTDSGRVIGGFLTCILEKSLQFRGTGETFLFLLSPMLKKYTWTGANPHFVRIENNSLMIGGGTGTGLWIDDELDRGMSETCETFDNEPLNGAAKDFTCFEVEVFGFCSSQ